MISSKITWKEASKLATLCKEVYPFSAPRLTSRHEILNRIVDIVDQLKDHEKYSSNDFSDIVNVTLSLRPLVTHEDSLIRAASFRALRYLLNDVETIKLFNRARLHFFLIRSLERGQLFVLERMEALKMIRKMVLIITKTTRELKAGKANENTSGLMMMLPSCLVQSLVCIALDEEDSFRGVCLEVLRMLSVTNPQLVAENDGFRAFLLATIDTSSSLNAMRVPLLLTIQFLLSKPASRRFFRPSLDFAVLFYPFSNESLLDPTDAKKEGEVSRQETKDSTKRKKPGASKLTAESKKCLQRCTFVISFIFKTWSGFMLLAAEPSCLKALIEVLAHPVAIELKASILSLLRMILIPTSTPYLDDYMFGAARSTKGMRFSKKPASGQFAPRDNLLADVWPLTNCYLGEGLNADGAEFLAEDALSTPGFGAGGCTFSFQRGNDGLVSFRQTMFESFQAVLVLAVVKLGLVDSLEEILLRGETELFSAALSLLTLVFSKALKYLSTSISEPLAFNKKLVRTALKDVKGDARDKLFSRVDAKRPAPGLHHAPENQESLGVNPQIAIERARILVDFLPQVLGTEKSTVLGNLLRHTLHESCYALSAHLVLTQWVHYGEEIRETVETVYNSSSNNELKVMNKSYSTAKSRALSLSSRSDVSSVASLRTAKILQSGSRAGDRMKKGFRKIFTGLSNLGKSNTTLATAPGQSTLGLESSPIRSQAEAVEAVKENPFDYQFLHLAEHNGEGVEQTTPLDNSLNFVPLRMAHNRPSRQGFKSFSMLNEMLHLKAEGLTYASYMDHVKRSKVLITKDWKRWNWFSIKDIVVNVIKNVYYLHQLLKTKFLKRVFGVFRLSFESFESRKVNQYNAEGDYIVGYAWSPDLLPYFVLLKEAVLVLLQTKEGRKFLKKDRRGGVLRQLLNAIDAALLEQQVKKSSQETSTSNDGQNRNILTRTGCNEYMLSASFSVLQAFTTFEYGTEMLAEGKFAPKFVSLCCSWELDYISELILVNLNYFNSESCRNLVRYVLGSQDSSHRLKKFVLNMLLAQCSLITTQENDFVVDWILDCSWFVHNLVTRKTGSDGALKGNLTTLICSIIQIPVFLKLLSSGSWQHAGRVFISELIADRGGEQSPFYRASLFKGLISYYHSLEAAQNGSMLSELIGSLPKQTFDNNSILSGLVKQLRTSTFRRGVEGASLQQPNRKTDGMPSQVQLRPQPIPLRSFSTHTVQKDRQIAELGCHENPDLLAACSLPWAVQVWILFPGGAKTEVSMSCSVDFQHAAGYSHPRSQLKCICEPWQTGGVSAGVEIPSEATIYAVLTLGGIVISQQGEFSEKPSRAGTFPLPGSTVGKQAEQAPTKNSFVTKEIDFNISPRRRLGWDDHRWIRCNPEHRAAGGRAVASNAVTICPCGSSPAEFTFKITEKTVVKTGEPNLQQERRVDPSAPKHVLNPLFASSFHESVSAMDVNRECSENVAKARAASQSSSGESSLSSSSVGNLTAERPDSFHKQKWYLNKIEFHLKFINVIPELEDSEVTLALHRGLVPTPANEITDLFKIFLPMLRLDKQVLLLQEYYLYIFQRKGYSHGKKPNSIEILAAIRSIGFACGTQTGLRHVMERSTMDVVKILSDIAYADMSLEQKGLAVAALGQISITARGRSLVQKYGWDVPSLESARSNVATVVPKAIEKFFTVSGQDESITIWNKIGKAVEGYAYLPRISEVKTLSELYIESRLHTAVTDSVGPDPGTTFPTYLVQALLHGVANLSNHITHNEGHRSLMKLYSMHRELFSSPVIYARVHQYLGRYDFQLRVRQFILDLFHRTMRFDRVEIWLWLDSVRFC